MSDNYVVKGRGPNRGKYLRIDWTTGKRVGSWEPSQKRAARLGYGREIGRGAEWHASIFGGYAVTLTCPKTLDVAGLKAFISERAAWSTEDGGLSHWVHGSNEFAGSGCDESDSFCLECCEAKVEQIKKDYPAEAEEFEIWVDGGWGSESDSPSHCATCDVRLADFLTDGGADDQLLLLTSSSRPSYDDREGWAAMQHALINTLDNDPIWRKIARVALEAARCRLLELIESRPAAPRSAA